MNSLPFICEVDAATSFGSWLSIFQSEIFSKADHILVYGQIILLFFMIYVMNKIFTYRCDKRLCIWTDLTLKSMKPYQQCTIYVVSHSVSLSSDNHRLVSHIDYYLTAQTVHLLWNSQKFIWPLSLTISYMLLLSFHFHSSTCQQLWSPALLEELLQLDST